MHDFLSKDKNPCFHDQSPSPQEVNYLNRGKKALLVFSVKLIAITEEAGAPILKYHNRSS